ncbi:MAG: UvrD-helicase domain-containing protein [bacterium]|nr:UvrD-helicase domain-containing protein [bacterium]
MSDTLLNDINPKQREAVEQIHGPVLILAGAGSGKTRVLTYRVAHLILDKHVAPERIIMVTFTNKAAGEMKLRIANLLEKYSTHHGTSLPFAGTFHSLSAKILRTDGVHIGISPGFVIYDEGDQLELIRSIMKEQDISTKNYNPRAIRTVISQAKTEMIRASEYREYQHGYFQETAGTVYLAYEKALRENQALDFDDLLLKPVQLFNESPITLGKYQERYEYVHVDEYQDTNKAQYTLSKLFAGRFGNICVVGDASQSIYRFRGADFRNIVNFKKDYPHAREFHLEQNYRSTQIILDAAYGVISKNTSHPILSLWTEKQKGPKIVLYEARNEEDEARFLIQTILVSGKPLTDFAVLYRTNAQSRVLEEALLHSGTPYVLVGGTRFYERKEVKDVLAYLRLIQNPKDTVSMNRVQKLGKGRYAKFFAYQEELQKDTKIRLISRTTLELLDEILARTQYLDLYDANVEEDLYRRENIKELRSVASEFPKLVEFLETVSLVEEESKPNRNEVQNRPAVTLMTLHAAKGLEFPVVFIVGMEEGLFPHARSLMEREEMEEERRLCYVGITRAKEQLYFTYANRRLIFGTRTQNMISRFIADVPENALDLHISLDSERGFRQDDYLL